MVHNYVIGVNILVLAICNYLAKCYSEMPAHCGGIYRLVEIRQLQKFFFVPFLMWNSHLLTALHGHPCPCLYSCLHFFHIHCHLRMCFITNCFPVSGSKTSEICWHFRSYLTMHSKPLIFQGFPLIFWMTIQHEMRDQNQRWLLALVSVQ